MVVWFYDLTDNMKHVTNHVATSVHLGQPAIHTVCVDMRTVHVQIRTGLPFYTNLLISLLLQSIMSHVSIFYVRHMEVLRPLTPQRQTSTSLYYTAIYEPLLLLPTPRQTKGLVINYGEGGDYKMGKSLVRNFLHPPLKTG